MIIEKRLSKIMYIYSKISLLRSSHRL